MAQFLEINENNCDLPTYATLTNSHFGNGLVGQKNWQGLNQEDPFSPNKVIEQAEGLLHS
jgi:hypothetical protein